MYAQVQQLFRLISKLVARVNEHTNAPSNFIPTPGDFTEDIWVVTSGNTEKSISALSNDQLKTILMQRNTQTRHPLQKWNTHHFQVQLRDVANHLESTQMSMALISPKIRDFQLRLQLRMLTMGDRRQYIDRDKAICTLCRQQILETSAHLFWECSFTKQVWQPLMITWQQSFQVQPEWQHIVLPNTLEVPNSPIVANERDKEFVKELWTITQVSMSNTIWRTRNELIFKHPNAQPNIEQTRRRGI